MNSRLLQYQKQKLIKAEVGEGINYCDIGILYPNSMELDTLTQDEIGAIERIQSMSFLRVIKNASIVIAAILAVLAVFYLAASTAIGALEIVSKTIPVDYYQSNDCKEGDTI